MAPIRLSDRSERSTYPVVIGAGLLGQLTALLAERGLDRQRLVVSSTPIWRCQGQRLATLIGGKQRPALIPDGERAKTLATVARIRAS